MLRATYIIATHSILTVFEEGGLTDTIPRIIAISHFLFKTLFYNDDV